MKSIKSILLYLAICIIFIFIYSFLFLYLMYLEGKHYHFITAVYWVLTTMTTVGYGDINFTSDVGHLYSIIVEISGLIMIFGLLFPFVITPWLEKKLLTKLPTNAPTDLNNHLIICGYNPLIETLIRELQDYDIPFIIIESREQVIMDLLEKNILCVYGDSSDEEVLKKTNIHTAKKLIANENDEQNANIVLTAKEISNIEIIALVEDSTKAKYLKYASADKVISPKTLFGTFMAKKAVAPYTDTLAGAIEFFKGLKIIEFPIYPNSSLIGMSLKEAKIRERTGCNIVGMWKGGELSLNPSSLDVIKENSALLAIGTIGQLSKLKELTIGRPT